MFGFVCCYCIYNVLYRSEVNKSCSLSWVQIREWNGAYAPRHMDMGSFLSTQPGNGPECRKPGMHNATRDGMPNGLNA